MNYVSRPYQTEDDFWRMRAFLRQVFVLNHGREWSWHVARLDHARWHSCLNLAKVRLEDVAFLWELDGELIGFIMPDCRRGEAHLCVHPSRRTPALEAEMLDVAEQRLWADGPQGGRRLTVWAPDQDSLRQHVLAGRGYLRSEGAEHVWTRRLDTPIADMPLVTGFVIRPLGDGLEIAERCYASGLAFYPNDINVAVERRNDPAWYRNIQTAPLYRRDLDLVTVARDGAIAAFCTMWFDDVTRSAYFGPVATVPAYQRRGLGKALMTAGLQRLQRMGCSTASVAGGTPAANSLYRSVMGPDFEMYEPWTREWKVA